MTLPGHITSKCGSCGCGLLMSVGSQRIEARCECGLLGLALLFTLASSEEAGMEGAKQYL